MAARLRWFFLAFLSAFVLLCEKDLTGPVTTSNNDPVDGETTLLLSKKIGSQGGSIQLDSLRITIPANAFQEETELSIFTFAETTPLDQSISSTIYQLDGLPEKFDPIEIRLAHHGSFTGDTLVTIGEKAFSKSRGDSAYSFIAQKVVSDSGMLVFTLGAGSSLFKSEKTLNKVAGTPIRFAALDGYTTVNSSNNHFEINVPVEMSAQAVQLGEFFEAAYDTFQNIGFSYTGRTTAVKVLVADLPHPGEYAFFMPTNPTDASIRANLNKGRFTISTNIINDPQQMAITAGHEFMHLVQNIYEFSDPYVKPEQLWLSEALAVWAEAKFADAPNYISSELAGHEIRFLLGWQHAAGVHGYGMSTLIKNMAARFGDAAVLNIVERIRAGNVPASAVDPVDAILPEISEPVGQFWHNTLGNYILGTFYGGAVNQKLLNDPANYAYTFTIDSPDDTLASMLLGFNDLSGALTKIELNDASIDSAASLIVSVDDSTHCGLTICAFKNGAINLLRDMYPGQNGVVEIKNLRQLAQADQDLIVLISNSKHEPPYDGTNDVNLTFRINMPNTVPAGSPPQLVVPNTINIGYWKYLRYCQTPYGENDALFNVKLSDPTVSATISMFKSDSGWIFSRPINGAASVDFTGANLSLIAPHLCPGSLDSIWIRAENDFGADTVFTQIAVGDFFDGVTLEDSLANWKDYFHPNWFCIAPYLSGPFTGSSLTSSVDLKDYQCGVIKTLWHSTASKFNLSLSDCKITGTGSSDYQILSTQAQPKEEEWICRYTFDNSYEPALASFDDVDYFLFLNINDVATKITRRELWTSSTRSDSTWTATHDTTGGFFLAFKGRIRN